MQLRREAWEVSDSSGVMDSTRPAPATSLASTAPTVDTSQPNTGENGAGGSPLALATGDSRGSCSDSGGGESPGSTGSTVSTNPSSGEGLMQQLTQLVQTQTDMVMAQTRAMSEQSLSKASPL